MSKTKANFFSEMVPDETQFDKSFLVVLEYATKWSTTMANVTANNMKIGREKLSMQAVSQFYSDIELFMMFLEICFYCIL